MDSPTSAPLPKPAPPMVVLKKVRRSFKAPGGREIVALDVPHSKVERGTTLTLLGPNGSGKSTLLHLISGLLRPSAGEIVVDGQPLGKLKEAQLDRYRAAKVGYLLQGGHLLDGFTAEENVMAAMLFAGVGRRHQRRLARDLLERFGVADRARHRPGTMSGGERQRVALARALANDPPLILADEPTASLDPPSAKRFAGELERLCRDEERTLIVATHHPELFGSDVDVWQLGKTTTAEAEEST